MFFNESHVLFPPFEVQKKNKNSQSRNLYGPGNWLSTQKYVF
jgi:hypothetical protein